MNSVNKQESCAIAKMTARCALYKYIVSCCGDMAIKIIQYGDGRHLEFVRIENSAIRSAVPENPTLEPNMKWIGSPAAEI